MYGGAGSSDLRFIDPGVAKPRKPRTPPAQRGPPPPQPKVGDTVVIIIKPYKNNVTVRGIVKRVLTRRKYHSRGHKVELRDGTIGRIVQLVSRR